ncbi:MAG: DnaJ domain-containing protein [Proteobacteria bacterium]|nr:DnaJ domain-containing protein [Pseudomonadota bacterium]MBU4294813.1 DnaJ domain-containing protein [Pseudomonadota bacterium]MCG2748091.1 DnaJ domain-containing protein [Desulfobulbaceae bacterium]
MEYKDYYKTLGVERDAGQDEIKRAYRKLARKFHPDVNKDADAEKYFKEIGEAYEVLKDPEKRTAYDHIGSSWQEGQEFRPPPDWNAGFEFRGGGFSDASGNYSDFFEELFGGAGMGRSFHGRRGGIRAKGEDHHAKIMINLEDSFTGSVQIITLQLTEVDETGRIVVRPHTLNVRIPKGIMEGQSIRLAQQGGQGFGGGPRGDLYIEVAFHPHRLFRTDKKDIYLELPITPWEAALGATVPVPTLGGRVEMKIPAGSQSGQKLRLKNKGLPGTTAGDQFVVLKVVVPRADSEAAKEIYEKMAAVMPMNPRSALGV